MNNLSNYKHIYKLINSKKLNDIFNEKLTIIIIELPKFRSIEKDLKNKEHLYLTFIDNETSHYEREELGKMDEGLKEAVEQIEKAVQNEEALRAYYNIQIKKMEIENQMQEANEKGIKKGKEEGKIETAIKLKNMGFSVEDIAKATDLNPEFITNL